MTNSKKAICFKCGAYRSRNMSDHLAGRGKYKRCTGQLGGYYDKNGLRIACYVLHDKDEDGLSASEWKERYYPEDGLHCLYIAIHEDTGKIRFGRFEEDINNKNRRLSFIKSQQGETGHRLLDDLSEKGCDLAECVFTSCFDLRLTGAKRYEYVDHLPPKYTIHKAGTRKDSAEIRITWTGPNGEEMSGNPFDEMQLVAMRILRRFFGDHPELLPDYLSELMEDDFFESDDAEAAVQSINDQLEALDEEKELYLAAWEEKRRALKRKAYEVSHGNAKRRRLDGGDEGSELSED